MRFYQFRTPEEYNDHTHARLPFSAVWTGFKENATAHGIPHVSTSRGPVKVCFWLLVSLACLSTLSYNGYYLFLSYFGYPVNVLVKVQSERQLQFPAISVCNFNPIRRSMVRTLPSIKEIIASLGDHSRDRRDTRGQPGDSGGRGGRVRTTTLLDDNVPATTQPPGNVPATTQHPGNIPTTTQPRGYVPTATQTDDNVPRGTQSRTELPTITRSPTDMLVSQDDVPDGARPVGRNTPATTVPEDLVTQSAQVGSSRADDGESRDLQSQTNPQQMTNSPREVTSSSPRQQDDSESLVQQEQSVQTSGSESSGQRGSTGQRSESETSGEADRGGQQNEAQQDLVSQESDTGTTVPTTTHPYAAYRDLGLVTAVPENDEDLLRLELERIMSDQEMSVRQSMGHQLQDFIIQCKYAGVDCNITGGDFYTIYNTNYGNCFTYNWGDRQDTRYSVRPGPVYGLHLTLNIDQYEYILGISPSAGVRVVIHPQGVMPFPEDQGISARTGQVTYIGMRKLVLSRLGGKYGDCVDTRQSSTENNIFAEEYGAIYSNKACERTCYQRYLMNECACADAQYPRYGLAFDYQVVSGCDSTNASQDACKKKITDMYAQDELLCDCPNSCHDSDYTTTISTAEWPQDQYKDVVKAAVGNVGTYSERAAFLYYHFDDDYAKNLLKLMIYYEEFNYEYIGETPAYESSNFVGDLGGILGLYLGVSIMTILEFVELFLDFIALALFKCCAGKEKKICPTPDPPEKKADQWAPETTMTKVEAWT